MDSFSSLDHKLIVEPENIFVKVLIPSNSGGVVIGKGGQAIVKAQEETGATVKISKVGEYFPETNERICVIHGDKTAINRMIEYISTCISEKSDAKSFGRSDRQRQSILVIPNSSAGLLIGREGETISNIKKESGAFIQVSPKTFNQIGGERCVMISGNAEQRAQATKMIVDKILEDPKLCSFPNLSYGGDASNTFSGSYSTSSMNMTPSNYDSNSFDKYHYPMSNLLNEVGLSYLNDSDTINAQAPSSSFTAPSIRTNSYSYEDHATASNNQGYHYKMSSKPQSSSSQSFHQMDFMASSSVSGITRTIDVEQEYVGAIIGPKGSAILELQEITNTSIKVSKKPDNANTTDKRTVSIYGFYQDVSRAYLLICDKIKTEQSRREAMLMGSGGGGMSSNAGSVANCVVPNTGMHLNSGMSLGIGTSVNLGEN